jgi:excisionase family DNA binding protein
MRMMIAAVARLADGEEVAMMPVEEEVSPQEAAEILEVSRPYAAKVFDQGAFPSRRVGTHRRALTADVLAYKQRGKEVRLAVLDELGAEGQRYKMGY